MESHLGIFYDVLGCSTSWGGSSFPSRLNLSIPSITSSKGSIATDEEEGSYGGGTCTTRIGKIARLVTYKIGTSGIDSKDWSNIGIPHLRFGIS